MPRPSSSRLVLLALLALSFAPPALAALAPITEQERALTAVEGQPGAPAVVLFERAVVKLMDYPRQVSSSLEVERRIKILTEDGKRFAEIEIAHGEVQRLSGLEARTVLADGRAVPVPDDAIFLEVRSSSRSAYVTKVAFPAVEVGAIVDYRYTLKWDSIYYLESWSFHNAIPTLLSEIVYHKPAGMAIEPWGRETGGGKLNVETSRAAFGAQIRAWMENLPALPDEPASFPAVDLASRFMAVPKEVADGVERWPLLESWQNVAADFEEFYAPIRNRSRKAKKQATELAAGKTGEHERAAAVFGFVRDEIRTLTSSWIFPDEEDLDALLAAREGSVAGKALLLQAMLDELKLKPRLVWAADRREGRIDPSVPNPTWFDRVLVQLELGGARVFLDPSDNTLGFGRLSPHYEGTQALLFDPRKPEIFTLPMSPLANNLRRAEVDLALDAEGRLAGRGRLVLTGHCAWEEMDGLGDPAATVEKWRKSLAEDWEAFDLADVTVEELVEEAKVTVSWSLGQRPEAVLGDEASLLPSRPLGPVSSVYKLPPEQRLTPVQRRFPDRDEVELRLSWPEGWEADVVPQPRQLENETGLYSVQVEVDDAARKLSFRRQVELRQLELHGRDKYARLRNLFATLEQGDADAVVLVRP